MMEKLEITINEMMADDGPVPVDPGHVVDTSNDMSYDVAWKGYRAGKGKGKKGPNGSGVWHRGKGAENGRAAEKMTEERKEVRRA